MLIAVSSFSKFELADLLSSTLFLGVGFSPKQSQWGKILSPPRLGSPTAHSPQPRIRDREAARHAGNLCTQTLSPRFRLLLHSRLVTHTLSISRPSKVVPSPPHPPNLDCFPLLGSPDPRPLLSLPNTFHHGNSCTLLTESYSRSSASF